MTTIQNVEQFQGLTVGSSVKVNEDEYLLTTEGWQRVIDGTPHHAPIRTESFVGAIRSGYVSVHDPSTPQVGRWYADPSYSDYLVTYVVIGAPPEDTVYWRCLRFMRNVATEQTIRASSFSALTPVSAETIFGERHGSMTTLVALYINQTEEVTRLAGIASQAIAPALLADIHYAMGNFDDADDRRRINIALANYDVGVEEDIDVEVVVRGTWRMDNDDVSNILGERAEGWVDSALIEFSNRITVTKRGARCQCSEVTWDDLASQLPSNVTRDTVTWTSEGCDAD